jgi:hypothetical protein
MQEHEPDRDGRFEDAVERLARAAVNLEPNVTLREALQAIAEASAVATRAESAVVRVLDPGDGRLEAAAVVTSSRARTAEIEGTRVAVEEIAADEIDHIDGLPPAVRRVAERRPFHGAGGRTRQAGRRPGRALPASLQKGARGHAAARAP